MNLKIKIFNSVLVMIKYIFTIMIIFCALALVLSESPAQIFDLLIFEMPPSFFDDMENFALVVIIFYGFSIFVVVVYFFMQSGKITAASYHVGEIISNGLTFLILLLIFLFIWDPLTIGINSISYLILEPSQNPLIDYGDGYGAGARNKIEQFFSSTVTNPLSDHAILDPISRIIMLTVIFANGLINYITSISVMIILPLIRMLPLPPRLKTLINKHCPSLITILFYPIYVSILVSIAACFPMENMRSEQFDYFVNYAIHANPSILETLYSIGESLFIIVFYIMFIKYNKIMYVFLNIFLLTAKNILNRIILQSPIPITSTLTADDTAGYGITNDIKDADSIKPAMTGLHGTTYRIDLQNTR